MPPKEPANPVRCPFCNLILGGQGFSKHCSHHHPGFDDGDNRKLYVRALHTIVKRNDINHPLRQEWRALHGLPLLK